MSTRTAIRSGDAPSRSRWTRALIRCDPLWIVIFALAVRGIVLADALDAPFWNVPLVDESAYLDLARVLATGGQPAHGAWYVAPGYVYVLRAFDALALGPLAVKLAQLLSGAATAWCVWRLARGLCGRAAAFAAGIASSLVPVVLLQELLLLKTAFATLAALGALVAIAPVATPMHALRRWLLAGVLLGSAVLLRGELVVVALAVCCAAALAARRGFPAAPPVGAPIAALALVACAVAVPTAQNWRWSHDFVPLAFGGGVNFYIGNHAGADGSYVPLRPDRSDPPQEEADAVLLASRALGHQARPSEVSRHWLARGLAFWRDAPLAALRLTLRKWALAWGPYELADTLSTAQAGRWITALRFPPLVPALALPLAAVALWSTRRDRRLWTLRAFIVGSQIAVVPFFLFERFRLHLMAACLPFAAWSAERAIELLRARRWRPVALGATAAVAVALVTIVAHVPRDEIVLRVNIGELLFQAGRYDEALREFEAVRAASPAAWRVDMNVANVEAALGHDAQALAALERVLAHLHAEAERTGLPSADELAMCHEAAGDLELRRGNRAAAERHWAEALRFASPGAQAALRAKLAQRANELDASRP